MGGGRGRVRAARQSGVQDDPGGAQDRIRALRHLDMVAILFRGLITAEIRERACGRHSANRHLRVGPANVRNLQIAWWANCVFLRLGNVSKMNLWWTPRIALMILPFAAHPLDVLKTEGLVSAIRKPGYVKT